MKRVDIHVILSSGLASKKHHIEPKMVSPLLPPPSSLAVFAHADYKLDCFKSDGYGPVVYHSSTVAITTVSYSLYCGG